MCCIKCTCVCLDSVYATGCFCCDFTCIPYMCIFINCYLCMTADVFFTIVTVYTCFITYCHTCGSYSLNICCVLMNACCLAEIFFLCMCCIKCTCVCLDSVYATGCFCCDFTCIPCMCIFINCYLCMTGNPFTTVITIYTCCVTYCHTCGSLSFNISFSCMSGICEVFIFSCITT